MTEYSYDDLFRLTAVSGPLGRRLEFIREPVQNRFTLVYPNGACESIEWIAGTRRFLRKMPDGGSIEYTLDTKDRVTAILWPGGEKAAFTYTPSDALESVRHGDQVVRFRRDANGHVAAEETATGQVQSTYDKQGRLTRLAPPVGDPISYTYDPDGFLTSISAWNRVIKLTPGRDGQFDEISYGGNVIERRKYGPIGRLEEAQVVGARGAVLSRQSYRYDTCERMMDVRDYEPLNGFSRHLSYDFEDRLVSDEGVRFESKYKYDLRGNMVQASAGSNRDVVQYGDMDEPVRVNSRKLDYDKRGNLLLWDSSRGVLKCRYDARTDDELRGGQQGCRVRIRRAGKAHSQVVQRRGMALRLVWIAAALGRIYGPRRTPRQARLSVPAGHVHSHRIPWRTIRSIGYRMTPPAP